MIKSTKRYFMIVTACILVCVIIGMITHVRVNGYADLTVLEQQENLDVCEVRDEGIWEYEEYEHMKVDTFSALKEQAPFIAKVRVEENVKRTMTFPVATKTQVTVEKVYKGEEKEGQKIWIYEPAMFAYDTHPNCYVSYEYETGYQIMKSGQEYYLFLQELPAKKSYPKNEEEKHTYLVFSPIYAKVPVQEGVVEILDKERLYGEELYTYGEVKDYEILTSSKKQIQNYLAIRKSVKEIWQ